MVAFSPRGKLALASDGGRRYDGGVTDDQNKREFERQPVHTEALIVVAHESGTGASILGKTRNLSAGGGFIETSDPPALGVEVQLFIGSASAAAALRAFGIVVHVEPGIGFGVQFLDADDASRKDIATFIDRFCQPST